MPTDLKDYMPSLPPWPRLLKQAVGGGIHWTRQVLFVKAAQANDASYFLFRDAVKGGQPTVWSLWTLSLSVAA